MVLSLVLTDNYMIIALLASYRIAQSLDGEKFDELSMLETLTSKTYS